MHLDHINIGHILFTSWASTIYNKSPGYCRETARQLYVTWNVSRCMVNATDRVNLRSTFCLPYYTLLAYKSATCRRLVRPPRARPARSVDIGLLVGGWRSLLITLRITPPARSGRYRALWRMNTNVGHWGVWAKRLVERSKNRFFAYPSLFWGPRSGGTP